MSKCLVAKHKKGSPVARGAALPSLLDAALSAAYQERATVEQKAMVAAYLAEARQDHKWLACDCQDHNGLPSPTPPLMMIGKREETYYLIRKETRPEHTENCPFRISQDEHRNRLDQEKRDRAALIDLDKIPQLLGDRDSEPTLATPSQATTDRSFRSPDEDKLFGILAWLIEGAGVHRCGQLAPDIKAQWDAIEHFAAGIQVSPKLTAYDLLIRGERYLFDDAYQKPFHAIKAKSEPDRKKLAYLLVIADNLIRHEDGSTSIETTRWMTGAEGKSVPQLERVPVYCEIRFPATDRDQAKAPYLVLLKLVETRAGKARVSHGVAQPIAARKDLFPVDSDQERKTYRKLLQIGSKHVEHGGFFELEKPVRGRNTPMGACRPDFIVVRDDGRSKANTLIVETMGFDTPEYRERKATTMLTMRQLAGDIVEDDRTGKTPDREADDLLFKRVSKWLIRGGGEL